MSARRTPTVSSATLAPRNLSALVSRRTARSRVYFEAVGRDRRARAPWTGAGVARAQPDERGDPEPARAWRHKPRSEIDGRRRDATCRSKHVRRRRPASRPSRRTRAGRRHRRRRLDDGRRIDGDGRADPGRESGRRRRSPAARSTGPARSSCAPSASAATRCWRASSGWSARHSGRGRRFNGSRTSWPSWFVPIVVVVALVTFVVWARLRPRAPVCARAGQRRRGADHRVPVRARARDADVDHGRDRSRRRAGRPAFGTPRRSKSWNASRRSSSTRPERSPRASRACDGGPRVRHRRRTTCCAWPRASRASASIRWLARSSRGAHERNIALAASTASSPRRARASPAWSTGIACSVGNLQASRRAGHRSRRLERTRRDTAQAGADRRSRGRRRQDRQDCWAWPIRSSRPRRRPSRRCTPSACRS